MVSSPIHRSRVPVNSNFRLFFLSQRNHIDSARCVCSMRIRGDTDCGEGCLGGIKNLDIVSCADIMSVRPSLHNIFEFSAIFCRGCVVELHVAAPCCEICFSWTRHPAHLTQPLRPSDTHSIRTMFILTWFWDILAQLGRRLFPFVGLGDSNN